MIDEDQCLQAIAKGDEHALRLLYNHYHKKVYNTAISYAKSAEDAEEILQDVFITVFNTAASFRSDSSLSTWIYRITINKALDSLRKKNSQKRRGIFTSIYRSGSNEIQHESLDFVHPGVKMENKEEARLIFKVIDDLSDNQKAAFILTQIEGLPQHEVADILNTTRKSVESLLQRAKANLRTALEKYYPERGKSKNNTSN